MTSFNNGLKVNVIKGASAEAITSATISCLSSKSTAIDKATEASASASTASAQASIATAQASIATTKANEASVSDSSAKASASTASLKANEASSSASSALTSKMDAATSEENALSYKNSASVSAATATNKASEASDSVDMALAYQYGAESAYNSTLSLVNNLELPSVTHTVDTVDDFGTIPNGIYTVIVKDINRGGTFIYDATQSAVNNGGTIFDGWVRQYSGAVNVKWFGAVGVIDDTVATQLAADYAAMNDIKLLIDIDIIISTVTAIGNLSIVGSGNIIKKDNTFGHLIVSAFDLSIEGVSLDYNISNNTNLAALFNTDCSIYHTGTNLYLANVSATPSNSINIKTTATSSVTLDSCKIDGGWTCVLISGGISCSVHINKGIYSNSSKYDNIQVLDSTTCVIDGVESFGAYRSGIVVGNYAKNVRIVNCHSHGNKIDAVSQGGWGIVCSVGVEYSVIANNILENNERGSISIDTYTGIGVSYTTSNTLVNSNICKGGYSGGYTTTGISINGAGQCTVSANKITDALQSILVVDSSLTSIVGNTIKDCNNGCFIQLVNTTGCIVSSNELDTCIASSIACIQVSSSSGFKIVSNNITSISGSNRVAFKTLGVCSDFTVNGNNFNKVDAGTGYAIYLTGIISNGMFFGNSFESDFAAWQYYMVATSATISNVKTENNEIRIVSVQTSPNRYILNGSNIIAGGDTINGVKDMFTIAQTWSFKKGYIAINSGIAQFWNGTSWTTI